MPCAYTLWYTMPDTTAQAAHRAFPKGNRYMPMRDGIGPIFANADVVDRSRHRGPPAESPARLAVVLVMMPIDERSDAEAAAAVRARIDGNYALALDRDDPGLDASIRVDVRHRLLPHGAAERLLTILLDTRGDAGMLRSRGRQRTDSPHGQATIRTLTRLTRVAETLRHARNTLAAADPAWLPEHRDPAWGERYTRRVEAYRVPKDQATRAVLVEPIGQDGDHRLAARDAATTPVALRDLPAIPILRLVWAQPYYGPAAVRWRTGNDRLPHAELITSPSDGEARYATKREIPWIGSTVHMTETGDDDTPHRITNGETTPATTHAVGMTDPIHTHLAERHLLPAEHLRDSDYRAAAIRVTSPQTHAVAVVGPVLVDTRWQARQADGRDGSPFALAWAAEQGIGPAGHPACARDSWSRYTGRRTSA